MKFTEWLFWLWHNLRVWVANRLHPLSAEQKRENDEELLRGGK